MFLLCVFLAEGGDIIVFSHGAVSAEERLLTSSSATTASWAKERNSLSALPYHIEHLSKVRFRNKSLWNAGLAEILKKNKMTNDSHVIHS